MVYRLNYSEDNSYFLFQIILDEHIDRDNVLMALKKKVLRQHPLCPCSINELL